MDERLVLCPVAFEEKAAIQVEKPRPTAEEIAGALTTSQLEKIAEKLLGFWRFRIILVVLLVIGLLISVPTFVMVTLHFVNSQIDKLRADDQP